MRVLLGVLALLGILATSTGQDGALAQVTAPMAMPAPSGSPPFAPMHAQAPYVIQLTPPKDDKQPDILKFRTPVVFVVVLGKDTAMNAKVATAMAKELAPQLNFPVVPEGEWELSDYIRQCKEDPMARGAFIVLPPAAGGKKYDYLLFLIDSVSVEFNAMISECNGGGSVAAGAAPAPLATPDVSWVAQTVTGEYGRSKVQLLPFAVLTSVYLAFAAQRTYQNTVTRVYPVTTPIPKNGEQQQTQVLSSSVFNPSGTSNLQNSVTSSVAAASLNFGREGDTNHLTLHAAEDGAHEFLDSFQHYCHAQKSANPAAPSIAPCDLLK
jgi:hypothetical protein